MHSSLTLACTSCCACCVQGASLGPDHTMLVTEYMEVKKRLFDAIIRTKLLLEFWGGCLID